MSPEVWKEISTKDGWTARGASLELMRAVWERLPRSADQEMPDRFTDAQGVRWSRMPRVYPDDPDMTGHRTCPCS